MKKTILAIGCLLMLASCGNDADISNARPIFTTSEKAFKQQLSTTDSIKFSTMIHMKGTPMAIVKSKFKKPQFQNLILTIAVSEAEKDSMELVEKLLNKAEALAQSDITNINTYDTLELKATYKNKALMEVKLEL